MSHSENGETNQAPVFITCNHCGHLVPESNMQLHLVRSCTGGGGGRRRQAREEEDSSDDDESSRESEELLSIHNNSGDDNSVDAHDSDIGMEEYNRPTVASLPSASSNAAIAPSAPPLEDDDDDDEVQVSSPPPYPALRRRRRGRLKSDRQDEVMQVGDVVNLVEHDNDVEVVLPDGSAAASSSSSNSDDEVQVVEQPSPPQPEEWACPRCTLLNPTHVPRCDACHLPAPGHIRDPDPFRTERLVDLVDESQMSSSSSSQQQQGGEANNGFIGGGALLGGLLGGTRALIRGRSIPGGALEGAVSGAVGGALLNEFYRDTNSAVSQQQQQQRYPNTRSRSRQDQPSSHTAAPHPRTVQIVRMGGSRRGGVTTSVRTFDSSDHQDRVMMQMLSMLLPQDGGRHHQHHPNIDRMSYEQLLEAFGDGSENRGASPTAIRNLPSLKVDDVEKLPIDKRKCSICLDDFKVGQSVRTLPCLHNFHVECVDKWLRSNATCPICKNGIE